MRIETENLVITEFDMTMAESVHLNSLDEENRHFVPDEVFETVEEAAEAIGFLIGCYKIGDGPLVYPDLLKGGTQIGHVQAVPFEDDSWEIGYHIGGNYTGHGYAAEVVSAFLPIIIPLMKISQIAGICLAENRDSVKIMERCDLKKVFEGMGNYQDNKCMICKFEY